MEKVENSLMNKIIEELCKYQNDPYGFVQFAFDWDSDTLKNRSIEPWQKQTLRDMTVKMRKGKVENALQYAVASGHGIGKAQPHSLEFDTPHGRIKFGELQVGNYVFGIDGRKTKVVAIHEQGIKKVYRVTLDDKTFTDCCEDHVWRVMNTRNHKDYRRYKNMTTKEIIDSGVIEYNKKARHRLWALPHYKPVDFKSIEVDLHPYVLGLWLADGNKNTSKITVRNESTIEKIESFGYCCERSTENRKKTISVNVNIDRELKDLGLFNVATCDRWIPPDYLKNDIESRLELLRGLLDADADITNKFSVVFSSTSIRLCKDVLYLVRSLGGKGRLQTKPKLSYYFFEGVKKIARPSWRCTVSLPNYLQIFYDKKKASNKKVDNRSITRWIESVECIGEENCRCITVENEDGLYLTNDFIVTHNSAFISWITLWAMSTSPNTRGVITANTETQLRTKTWAELHKWNNLFIAKDLFEVTATAIYAKEKALEKTWRIDCVPFSPTNTESFAGLHNQGNRIIVLFDEASSIIDKIWEVVEGALTDVDSQRIWIAFGNPTRNQGRFVDCFTKFRHRWNYKQVDSREVSFTDKKLIEKWANDYGEDSDFFRVRVKGQFPKTSDRQFISQEFIDNAIGRGIAESSYSFAPIIIGVDPAYSGEDEAVIIMRQGLVAKVLGVYRKVADDVALSSHIAKFEDHYKADAVFVDMGYGTGIISIGKNMGRSWQLVAFGSQSSDPGFLNKRAEMWGLCRDWLKDGGCLPDDEQLARELAAPESFVNINGKIQLESKDDIKKRLGYSPDRADALCLTFAFPVIKKNHLTNNVKNKDYDPLNNI